MGEKSSLIRELSLENSRTGGRRGEKRVSRGEGMRKNRRTAVDE